MNQLMTKLFLGHSELVQKCISSTFLLDPIEAHPLLELVGHKNGPKTPFLWPTNDSFVALTLCAKKEDSVKIEIHCTNKIRLG